MADAEHMALEAVEPAAERHVELVEAQLTYLVGVVALGHLHGGDRIGLRPRVDRKDLRSVVLPPDTHRAPRRLGEAVMAREDVVERLLLDHAQRFLQAIEE